MMKSWQRIYISLTSYRLSPPPPFNLQTVSQKTSFLFWRSFCMQETDFFQALPHSTEANSNLVPEQEELLTGCNNSVVTTPPCCFISKAVTSLLVQHTSLRVRPVTTLCSVFWFFYSHISYWKASQNQNMKF